MLWFSNYSVQGHLDNFVEAVDSTYGCVLLRGQILTATKNWWGLHPDEIVLIMNYLLSEIPAVLKDTPVFLPVNSPTVSSLKAENIYTFPRAYLRTTVCRNYSAYFYLEFWLEFMKNLPHTDKIQTRIAKIYKIHQCPVRDIKNWILQLSNSRI